MLTRTLNNGRDTANSAEAPTIAGPPEPGMVLGTPAYISPEQARGRTVDERTDIWIEIKKSNQTARQALHELHKYAALPKHDHGLVDSNLRCIVVSTEWHELLVPFSEFQQSSAWTVDGYHLLFTDTGDIAITVLVIPGPTPPALRLYREHFAFFFRDAT